MVYMWFKAMFHHLITSRDQRLEEYFASHYFPRLLESYPDVKYLYGPINILCSYCLIMRILKIRNLIRKSIINKNGYKHVDVTQLNFTFLTTLCWKLGDWVKILRIWHEHGNLIARRRRRRYAGRTYDQCAIEREKQAHFSLPQPANDGMNDIYLSNLIDFTECYKLHNLHMNDRCIMIADTWYIPEYNCRADLLELSWVVYLVSLGIPMLAISILSLLVTTLFVELAYLAPETSLCKGSAQIVYLLTDPNHLIRLIDSHLLILCQMSHHLDAAMTYIDLVIFASRVRKVSDRFQNDLDFCRDRAHQFHSITKTVSSAHRKGTDRSKSDRIAHTNESPDQTTGHFEFIGLFQSTESPIRIDKGIKYFPNITAAEKAALNKNLKSNISLTKSIEIEFQSLRESLTTYFDILLFGCGLSFSAVMSLVIVIESRATKILLMAAIWSISYPLAMIVVFAVMIEYRVSLFGRRL